MQQSIEQELILDKVTIQIASFSWDEFEEALSAPGYRVSQRLSDDHAPLQFGNLSRMDVLPRVNSVGFFAARAFCSHVSDRKAFTSHILYF